MRPVGFPPNSRPWCSRTALPLVLTLVLCGPFAARAGDKPLQLIREMKGADVGIVPPRAVHIRGTSEGKATVRHHPLQGYDHDQYPTLFGELAQKLMSKGPTRWQAVYTIPDESFYFGFETEDPDGAEAVKLQEIPEVLAGHDYLAAFRYAELSYGVTTRPHFTKDDKVVMEHLVYLSLDLQLVVYDGATGGVVGVFDAESKVEVPEIQARSQRSKAFYRATVGAIKLMKTAIRKGE